MKIEDGRRVRIEYELAVADGEVIESSRDRGPLEFVQGIGGMLPGLEQRIAGLTVGDEREGVIPAAEAYGTVDMLPTKTISKQEFGGDTPVVGKQYQAKDSSAGAISFTVIEEHEEDVLVRFDHPLAGKDIRYRVKILAVEPPSTPPPLPDAA